MARIITDFEQQSPEWYFAHYGRFSGSDFHTFLGNSKTKEELLWEKVGERRWEDSDVEPFINQYTERGKILEHEARRVYSAIYNTDVKECGLVEEDGEFDTWAVCSPDGLVGDEGIIEIKCVPKDTEVLTSTGFVKIQNLTKDSIICESDDKGNLFWCKPKMLIKKPFNGELCNFYRNNKLALQTTPEHRLLCHSPNKKQERFVVEAKDFSYNWYRMFYGGHIAGCGDITPRERLYLAIKADGHKSLSTDEITFNFSKTRKIKRIKTLCEAAGVRLREGTTRRFPNPNWKPSTYFYIKDQGYSGIKHTPYKELFPLDQISSSQAREILLEAALWDGALHCSGFSITSVSKEDCDFFIALGVIANMSGQITTITNKDNSVRGYMASFGRVKGSRAARFHSSHGFKNTLKHQIKSPYDGWVYCINTTHGFFVTRTGTSAPVVVGNCLIAKNFLRFTDPKSDQYEYIEPKYRTQVQFNLFVTERQWCDFVYYHPRGGMHVIHIERDEAYIEKIKTALRECIKFIEERL